MPDLYGDLCRREHVHPGCCQQDRQRHALYQTADLDHVGLVVVG
jgi:hypothetical protein